MCHTHLKQQRTLQKNFVLTTPTIFKLKPTINLAPSQEGIISVPEVQRQEHCVTVPNFPLISDYLRFAVRQHGQRRLSENLEAAIRDRYRPQNQVNSVISQRIFWIQLALIKQLKSWGVVQIGFRKFLLNYRFKSLV